VLLQEFQADTKVLGKGTRKRSNSQAHLLTPQVQEKQEDVSPFLRRRLHKFWKRSRKGKERVECNISVKVFKKKGGSMSSPSQSGISEGAKSGRGGSGIKKGLDCSTLGRR